MRLESQSKRKSIQPWEVASSGNYAYSLPSVSALTQSKFH